MKYVVILFLGYTLCCLSEPPPGAAWYSRTLDRSSTFDHGRQCDGKGCLYTDTEEAHMRSQSKYYVPHANGNAVAPYYAPATAIPGVRYSGKAADFGPTGKYWDGNGNPISYAEFRRQVYGQDHVLTAPTPGWGLGAAGDFGPTGKYKDGYGRPISYAEFRRQVYGK